MIVCNYNSLSTFSILIFLILITSCSQPTDQNSSWVNNIPSDSNMCKECHDISAITTHPKSIECHQCHLETVDKSNIGIIFGGKHQNGKVDILYIGCSSCHSLFIGDKHPNSKDCFECHSPTMNDDNTINNNAHTHVNGIVEYQSCLSCHATAQDNGDGRPLNGRRKIDGDFTLNSHHIQGSVKNTDCIVCHDMTNHQDGNLRFNNVDDPDNPDADIELTGDPKVSQVEAMKLVNFCSSCHDNNGSAGSAPFSDGIMPTDINYGLSWQSSSHAQSLSCFGNGVFGCHSSGHGSLKKKLLAPENVAATAPAYSEEREEICYKCHDVDGPSTIDIHSQFSTDTKWQLDPGNRNANLNDRHDVHYIDQQRSGAVITCTDCHNPHTDTSLQKVKSDPDPMDGGVPGTGNILPGATFMTEWCLDCHDGSFPSTVSSSTITLINIKDTHSIDYMGVANTDSATLKTGYGWRTHLTVDCLSCHSAHPESNNNFFQLKNKIKSVDNSIEIPSDNVGVYRVSNNNSIDKSVNGYNLCNTCHTSSMGNNVKFCFNCHYHGAVWQGAPNF